MHLLQPSPAVNQNFKYCLGVAAERFDIGLYAWLAMSNHLHTALRDRRGNLPGFTTLFYSLLGRVMSAHRGLWANFWAYEQPSAVRLLRPEDTLDKITYAMLNPVEAGIVERVAEWPGASSLAQNLGLAGPERVERPKFFREDGPLPPFVTLTAIRPPGFESLSDQEWFDKLALHIRSGEEAARDRRRASGQRVLGVEYALTLDPFSRPTTAEPRRQLRPTVACRDEELRKAELLNLRGFRAAHRRARRELDEGRADVEIPAGTYAMNQRRPLLK